MSGMLILQFLVLTAVVTGTIIFFLHRFLIASTDGAVRRLNSETEVVRSKQADLNKKIKEAEEELDKRRKEAEELKKKMITEAEEKAKEEREKMVTKARVEGEEIIAKAQGTKDKIREELKQELAVKTVDVASQIMNAILSEKARGLLSDQLVADFLADLEKVDMSQIGPDIDTADVVTVKPLESLLKEKFLKVLKGKLNRDIKINNTTDASIIGGVVLKFGSLALDGSLQNSIKEAGTGMKDKIEKE